MPTNIDYPLAADVFQVFNPIAGTSTGVKVAIPLPIRGYIREVGFCPNSLVASAMTLQVNWGNNSSSTASNFTTVVTSTLGTFSSTVLYEGVTASVQGLFQSVAQGDCLEFVTSGGNSSAIGATVYCILQRG